MGRKLPFRLSKRERTLISMREMLKGFPFQPHATSLVSFYEITHAMLRVTAY
jgi:hypothetical protein